MLFAFWCGLTKHMITRLRLKNIVECPVAVYPEHLLALLLLTKRLEDVGQVFCVSKKCSTFAAIDDLWKQAR